MQVTKLSPQSYCKGVILALKKCISTIEDIKTERPIYLLGMIIHNKFVCDELKKMGITILEGDNKVELLDQINSGTVIISAHGVSLKVKEKAKSKGLNVIDATCPDVEKVHQNIFLYLNDGYEILYIGKKNHPESTGVLEESNKIYLLDSIDNIKDIDKNKKYYVTNQTTLSLDVVSKYHEEIKKIIPNAIIENKICMSTTRRELALNDIKHDLIIVVGDKKSSNTHKLYETAKNKADSKEVILIESAHDLLNFDFKDYQDIAITSGASTPIALVDQIVKYIENGFDKEILNEELFFFI